MLDFAAIRRRIFGVQEREGLGTDAYALSQDAWALLDVLKDATMERDEARELHAQMCNKYADAVMRLHRISSIIASYQSAHAKDNVEVGPDREAVASNGKFIGTIVADEALDIRYRIDMKDAGRGHLLR